MRTASAAEPGHHRAGGDRGVLDDRAQHRSAGVDLAEHVAGPDPHPFEGHERIGGAGGRLLSSAGEALGVGRHEEDADAVRRRRRHQQELGDQPGQHVGLGALEHPAVAVGLGRRGRDQRVGQRLDQRGRGHEAAGGQTGEERRLLLGGAEAGDRHPRERERRQRGHGRGPAAHLLQHEAELEQAQPCAAVLLGHRDAEQPGVGHGGPEVAIEAEVVALLEGAQGLGGRLVGEELGGGLGGRLLLVGQIEVHGRLPLSAWPWACPCRTRRSGLVGARSSHRRR